MRIIVASLRKLVRRPATFVTLGLLVALLSIILLAVSATANQRSGPGAAEALLLVTFPGAYTLILSFILGLGGLFAVVYGAAIAGSEWTWGTLKAAVARGESRVGYQLLTFLAIALMLGIGAVIAFVVGVGVAILGANIAGVSTAGLNDADTIRSLPELLGRGWIAIVEEGALGFAIATLARSQLAGIGAGIGFYFGEQFAAIFLPEIVKWLPFNAANAAVSSSAGVSVGGSGVLERLDPNTALVVVAAWLVGALLVSAVFSDRAEIAG